MPSPLNPFVLSEKFFHWGHRTKFFRQLVAFAVTGTGAYVLFHLWWDKHSVWYLLAAIVCAAPTVLFGLLAFQNIVDSLRRALRWKFCSMLVAVTLIEALITNYHRPTSDPNFWIALVSGIIAAWVALDLAAFPVNDFKFVGERSRNRLHAM